VWSDLKDELGLERAQLRKMLSDFAPLREKSLNENPDLVGIAALAAFLHSFYNGVENLFKRIAVHLDGGPPQGEFWHSELLKAMKGPGARRPAVIDEVTYERLRQYMDFRHMFRHAYSHELRWSRMAPLVRDCQSALELLEEQMERFTAIMDAGVLRGALTETPSS
jgi:hypothetical protein